jgi:hypothetical protein
LVWICTEEVDEDVDDAHDDGDRPEDSEMPLTRINGRVRNCHATLVKDIRIMLNRLFAMTMLQSSNSTLQDIQTFQKAMQKNAMALCFPQATFCIRSGVLDNK